MPLAKEQADFQAEGRFHEREWFIQRIGWGLMLVFVVAAALGLFGNGLLSQRHRGDSQTATLTYERFARYASSQRLELTIAPQTATAGEVSFDINEAYLSAFELKTVVPEPQTVEAVGDWVRFRFAANGAPATITLDLMPEKIGTRNGVIKVRDRELAFAQFIYP
jgi:hypothetical protein